MYVLLPGLVPGGLADHLMHRRSSIERYPDAAYSPLSYC
jgi:hypothetical protein